MIKCRKKFVSISLTSGEFSTPRNPTLKRKNRSLRQKSERSRDKMKRTFLCRLFSSLHFSREKIMHVKVKTMTLGKGMFPIVLTRLGIPRWRSYSTLSQGRTDIGTASGVITLIKYGGHGANEQSVNMSQSLRLTD